LRAEIRRVNAEAHRMQTRRLEALLDYERMKLDRVKTLAQLQLDRSIVNLNNQLAMSSYNQALLANPDLANMPELRPVPVDYVIPDLPALETEVPPDFGMFEPYKPAYVRFPSP